MTTPLDIYKKAENKGYFISAFGAEDDEHGFEWIRKNNSFFINDVEVDAEAFIDFYNTCHMLIKEMESDTDD